MSGLALERTIEGGEAGSMVSLSLGSEIHSCRSRRVAASAPCSTSSAPVERRRSRRSTDSPSSARSRSTPASARRRRRRTDRQREGGRHGVRCCDPRDRRAPRPASRREGVLEPADPRLRRPLVRSTVRRGGVDLLEHDEVPRRVGDHGLARAALELPLRPDEADAVAEGRELCVERLHPEEQDASRGTTSDPVTSARSEAGTGRRPERRPARGR